MMKTKNGGYMPSSFLYFCGHFYIWVFGHWPLLFGFSWFWGDLLEKIFTKSPLFLAIWPFFFLKWAALEASVHAGSRGLWPLSHFFFNLLLLKNNNIIYNWQIKVGFWPQQYFVPNHAKNTSPFMEREERCLLDIFVY